MPANQKQPQPDISVFKVRPSRPAPVLVNGKLRPVYVSQSRDYIEYELRFQMPDGVWRSLRRRKLEDVPGMASVAEAKIALAREAVRTLYGDDAIAYKRALVGLAKLKMPLDRVIDLVLEMREVTGGHDLRQVAHFYASKGMLRSKVTKLCELVEEYLKKEYGSAISKVGAGSEAQAFAKWVYTKFGRDVLLSDLRVELLNEWVHGRPSAKAYFSKLTCRRRLVTLFNFAKTKGFLPKGEPTIADEIDPVIEKRGERKPISLFDSGPLRTLIYHLWMKRKEHIKYENALCYVLVGAFLGLRADERTRVTWVNLDMERGRFSVEESESKVYVRREMPIPPNLMAFFRALDVQKATGVLVETRWIRVASEEARKLGIKWPHNGLRHVFASSWHALVGNKELLAEYMGTSVEMLDRHYLRKILVMEAWSLFGIYPPGYAGALVTGDTLVTALRGIVSEKGSCGNLPTDEGD